jgi:hypothetical protein
MGIDMADEIREHTSNARGHWERWEIVEFHDRILGMFNRDYYGPLHDFSLPVAWWADPRVFQLKRELIAFLERRMGAGWFGFKDPRTVRLMPLWHQIFNDLRLAPKIVLCLRNPAQVARSLGGRDGLDPALGEYRWLTYMVEFFRYCGRFEVCTVDYESWFTDPYANFEKLKKLLDVEWQQSRPDLDLVLSGIVDPTLRHDTSHYSEPHQPLVGSLYRLAGDWHRDGGVRDEVNSFVAQFISFEKLQAPLHQGLENHVATAAKYPGLERETSALRAEVEQHAASEAALRAEIEQHAVSRTWLRAEIERNLSTEAALRAEVEQHAAREAALRAEVEQYAAREAVLRTEIAFGADTEAALRTALRSAERRIERWKATVEAREAEITAQRDALTKVEQRLQAQAAAAEASQTERETLRGKLAEAEQRCREHEAAYAALQAEVTSLNNQLAVAREVGGAAIAALKAEPAAAPAARRNGVWFAGVLRLLRSRARLPLPSPRYLSAGIHSRI